MNLVLIALAAMLALAGPAMAESHCNTPMSRWQPPDQLIKKLEAENWHVERLGTDDGCYKVHARNEKGERLKALYDPATLEIVEMEQEKD